MAELNETPRGNRIHIAFFGLRNAGKSTLVNAFTGQPIAIVSDVPGTTTDPVSKAMEILPLGPCLVTDTAGLDDEGALGEMRVEKTLKVLETVDIAVWVDGAAEPSDERKATSDKLQEDFHSQFLEACKRRKVTVLEYRRGDSVEELKRRIAAVKLEEPMPGLLDGLVEKGDRVVCVVPIDESAPKGRLILPQQQVIRECLDRHVACTVCQPEELFDCSDRSIVRMTGRAGRILVVTDSQAFGKVNECIKRLNRTIEQSNNRTIALTSFSILFARQKGDLDEYVKGLKAIANLQDDDSVLIAEGCTHHRQCNDIGSTKIPKALERLSGKSLRFEFASGAAFVGEARDGEDALRPSGDGEARDGQDARRPSVNGQESCCDFKLIVQCGGCMLTRREMLRRIAVAKDAGVPIVNYGMVLAAANGIPVEEVLPSTRLASPV